MRGHSPGEGYDKGEILKKYRVIFENRFEMTKKEEKF